MRRYRPLIHQFDLRALYLQQEVQDDWEPQAKEAWHGNQRQIRESLVHQYGAHNYEKKISRFASRGRIPLSIIAFHNQAFPQIRDSYVMEAYYPALTSACALGEWILNHLLLGLRDAFRSTPEFKKIYRKDSVDDWRLAIDILDSWEVLRPETLEAFRELRVLRNNALHFRPGTVANAEQIAGEAIDLLVRIIDLQFGAFGDHPWFCSVPGAVFIRKSFEDNPFVKLVYIPNCTLVGPEHELKWDSKKSGFIVQDREDYEDRDVSDEEFLELYLRAKALKASRRDT